MGTFSFTTNEKGIGTKVLDLERPKEGYYTVELTWNDNNGRTMSREVYLSSWNYIGIENEYDWYHLETDKEKYRTGEEAVVTLKNNDKTVSAGPVLFIEARNGITGYNVQSGPEYKTVFSADKIPNFYVKAVYFNGKCYIEAGSVSLAYDTAEKKINFEMKTDKSSYRPGDTVNISITATDENKNPVPARVNIAIIDEAILEISYYNADVLGRLYQWLSSGIIGSYSSHLVGQSSLDAAGGGGYTAVSEEKAMFVAFKDSASMDQIRARSDFRDTALFKTITLDRDGKGTVSFKLPDNVTSWHVTLAGITTDLRGGTGESSLKVTLPFLSATA